ncbi:helix-turn-helix domain-containing protein, partial [Promicromonospora kroppenstedtii]
MLDVHRLRVFRSVVASGSIGAAAANLGYTPSAVSQHVSALQRETGLKLLARHGRGIRPTAAGRALA